MLIFVLPLQSPQASRGWQLVSRLCERTLRSICQQTLDHFRVILVCNERPACFRILKPGGIFRIAVPDAELLLRLYAGGDRTRIFELYPKWVMDDLDFTSPMEMVNYVFRDSIFNQHLFAWDFETLDHQLRKTGFGVAQTAAGSPPILFSVNATNSDGCNFRSMSKPPSEWRP